jgi:hypothetical protein
MHGSEKPRVLDSPQVSREHYKTLEDVKDTSVALTSGFGTEKTIFLIKAKSKALIAKKPKQAIVIFETTSEKTILRIDYEKYHNEMISTKITSLSGTTGDAYFNNDLVPK